MWCTLEISFFLLAYLPVRHFSQRKAIHPPLALRLERRKLFDRCIQTSQDPERYVHKWFRDAPLAEIKHENVRDFLTWGFLNTDRAEPEDDEEVDEYVEELGRTLGRPFEKGRGTAVPIRLTLDPVTMVHRPLIWYMIVGLVDVVTHVMMFSMGFSFYRPPLSSHSLTLPLRPQTLVATKVAPTTVVSYWYKPHTSRTKLPILFVHGIGIGLFAYIHFLKDLIRASGDQSDGEVGILAVEILPISFRVTHPMLETGRMCREVELILKKHGLDQVVLVSHSYGSVVTTHLLKHPNTASHIASVVLVDPVSILLHLPDVAYNFVYRPPTYANEWQLWYFASTDMGVAHTLARSFFWSENILWKEDLGDRETTVFLAEKDLIVNTKAVAEYLSHDEGSRTSEKQAPGGRESEDGLQKGKQNVEVVWCDGLDHASIFHDKRMRELVDAVVRHCRSGSSLGRANGRT